MDMTNEQYGEYIKRRMPRSPIVKDTVLSFLVGGAICCVGQAIMQLYGALGLDRETASTAVSITMVFFGALFTGLGFYDDIARFAGGGTLVPITGFANAMVSPALEYKAEGMITGMAVKMFSIAGPVIVFGVSASVVYGLVLALLGGV